MTGVRRAYLLCAVGGVVLGICSPPRAVGPLVFVVLPLWMLAVEELARAPARRGRALLAGLIAGTAVNVIALWWVIGLLQAFGHFPLVAALPTGALLWIAQAMPFVIAIVCATVLVRAGAPSWLTLPACVVVTCATMPALFPWHIAVSQVEWITWIQPAELGGEPLLDLCVGLASTGLVEWSRSRSRRAGLVGLAALFLPLVWGVVRLPQVTAERDAGELVRVGVVQPNLGIDEKHDPDNWFAHLALLQEMTRVLEQQGADVVLWPETAYPFPWARDRTTDDDQPFTMLARGAHGPLLAGAVTRRSALERWNSAVGMERGGRVTETYDKVELLAFGEFVPLWHVLPPLQASFRSPGLTAGEVVQTVGLGHVEYGVLICYEDILPGMARRVARLDPDILVNLTNDAWFGDTAEPWQHDALARMRAIETRRDLVRAVNTGVSAHVLATGEQVMHTETFERRAFIAEARAMHATTPFTVLGDWVTPACLGALLGAVFALRRRTAVAGGTAKG